MRAERQYVVVTDRTRHGVGVPEQSEDGKQWLWWWDTLGRQFTVGDRVAVAVINGRSPQLVVVRVDRINRVNSKGKDITESVLSPDYSVHTTYPSCTVRATPLLDGRGFHRWGVTASGEHNPVTYQFPGNMLKVVDTDVCPFDCDGCHGEDCPCTRGGCRGDA